MVTRFLLVIGLIVTLGLVGCKTTDDTMMEDESMRHLRAGDPD
ncbi:MAG: hypothetical protein ACOCYB_10920 [Alkalispirochaeta sp.]